MRLLAKNVETLDGVHDDDDKFSISVTFNQQAFKQKLTQVSSDTFITMVPTTKKAQVTQSKRFPRPSCFDGDKTSFGVTYPTGWKR